MIAAVAARDLLARRIDVDVASHHPIIDPILPELRSALADLAPKPPAIPMITTALDGPTPASLGCRLLGGQPTQPGALPPGRQRGGAEHHTFVEVSPHPLLTYAITDTLGETQHARARHPAARHRRHRHLPHQPQRHPHHPPARHPAPPRTTSAAAHHPVAAHPPLDHRHGRPHRTARTPIPCWASASTIPPTGPGCGSAPSAQTCSGSATTVWTTSCVLPGAAYAEIALAAATDTFGRRRSAWIDPRAQRWTS